MEQQIVGIDVAKERLDVHVRPQAETFGIAADESGMHELVERLRQDRNRSKQPG